MELLGKRVNSLTKDGRIESVGWAECQKHDEISSQLIGWVIIPRHTHLVEK